MAPLTSQRVKFEIWLVNLVGKHILQPGSRNLESWSFVGVNQQKSDTALFLNSQFISTT